MAARSYWLDLFTWTTWKEFLESGGDVSGFRERRQKTVQKIKTGDYLLCYLTGVSRFIGILEVTSPFYRDNSPIWKDEDFPCRLKVKVVIKLEPETAVPVYQLKDQLTIFHNLKNPNAWTGHVRGSPAKWKSSDGEAVLNALLEAKKNPVVRPVDSAKLARRPKALKAKIGSVTVPEKDELDYEIAEGVKELTSHTEIQWLLLKLGSGMKLDVWVARNDRGKEANGQKFADLPRLKDELPLQFDEATNRTIEHIDVLWLKGNAIVAAFEIESTSSIYSGLLRMSDLIAMQPNLNIPLHIVAPDERRDKVISEVNRPTFSQLSPPMSQICRFIPFSALRKAIAQITLIIQYLKPEFLEELSESCEIEEV
jgi:predicted RNA-binding protein